jgi:NAD-dependent deacetylase
MTTADLSPELDADADDLAAVLAQARSIVAFTGAGISTECGVPDFRSPGSPWMTHKPIAYDAYLASPEARLEAWRRKFVMDDLYRHARPGRGHRALVDLHRDGRLTHVVTQNIDNLHQLSGLGPDAIIELHGNGSYAACLQCGRRHELAGVRSVVETQELAPSCEDCGGIVKSATISFGQAMPVEAMKRAQQVAAGCDLLLVLGSSLVVQPAARIPLYARQNGAFLAIVNREPTPLDGAADLVIRADVGSLLELAVAKMRPSVVDVKNPL